MKRSIMFISLLMLILVFALSVYNTVYASTGGEIIGQLEGTMQAVTTPDTSSTGEGSVGGAINKVIGIIQVAGTGIALIMLSILGIKYMLASPSEKADVKKQILPFAIGCILLFGAVTVVGLIANLSTTSLGAGG